MLAQSNTPVISQNPRDTTLDLVSGPVTTVDAPQVRGQRVILPGHAGGSDQHKRLHVSTATSTSVTGLGSSVAIPLTKTVEVLIQGPEGIGTVAGVFIPNQGFRVKQGDNFVEIPRDSVSKKAYEYIKTLERSVKTPLNQTQYQQFVREKINRVNHSTNLPRFNRDVEQYTLSKQ
jgi:hypothetical protein